MIRYNMVEKYNYLKFTDKIILMGLSKSFMAEIYEAMPDEELIAAATNNIKDLTPGALEALNDELRRRGLKDKLNDAIKIQQKKTEPGEFLSYVNLIRTLPCPVCSKTDQLLNGAVLVKIVTAIVFSSTHREFLIACPTCLKEAIDKSGGVAFSLDAVHMIKGIVETIKVTKEIQQSLAQLKADAPSDSLLYFIHKKIGEIELYKDNPKKLEEMVKYANASFS